MSDDDSRPHCLLAYRWVAAWVHILYFLSDKSVRLQEYHEFFSRAHTSDHLSECVRHFFHYFITLENIHHVTNHSFDEMTLTYGGTLPLRTIVTAFSDRDKEIFRTFTLDVFMSVADPVVASEAGLVPTPEEEYWFSNLSKPTSL